MERKVIYTDKAPAAVGPYSQAVAWGNTVYVSGQLPLDPAQGKIVAESIEDQTRQAMENLKSILEEAGSSLDRLLKVTIFLQDMGDFKRVNEAYGGFFSGDYPARCAYQVAKLPLGANIEIDGIAAI
ncbi:MAG: RidA family protein [Spirochaetaceae bacterium]|nr:RidA family protein [Spirochaetaceae bacterium]MCF7949516.1 RidA family protein [Spirochaetia bacterium]MCF7951340.1 RidA family protein [Spirochaetaceae bacterium]